LCRRAQSRAFIRKKISSRAPEKFKDEGSTNWRRYCQAQNGEHVDRPRPQHGQIGKTGEDACARYRHMMQDKVPADRDPDPTTRRQLDRHL